MSKIKKKTHHADAEVLSRRGPGRPPKAESERLQVIGTRVSPRVYRRLMRKADAQEVKISDIIRDICEEAVKKRKDKAA